METGLLDCLRVFSFWLLSILCNCLYLLGMIVGEFGTENKGEICNCNKDVLTVWRKTMKLIWPFS